MTTAVVTGSQLGSDLNGEATGEQFGHSVSLSGDGNTLAVGAPYNDGNGSGSGQVQLYRYDINTGSWSQLGSDLVGEAPEDNSGWSVSLSGDGNTLAVGAPNNDGNGSNSGQVRLYGYDTNSGSWSQLGSDLDGEAPGDSSGWSVSLSEDGNTLAVGAPNNDGSGNNSGQVRLYRYDTNSGSGSWSQLIRDLDGEAAGDGSGYSVSLSGDGTALAIGAPNNNASDTGQVRVYGNANPVLSLSGLVSAYRENGEPARLDAMATATDDSTDFDTGALTVRVSADGTVDDRLSIQNQGTAAGQISLDGRKVLYGGTRIGTYTGGIGTESLVIRFNANANSTNVQALIQNLNYSNVSEALVNGSRTVELILTDGDGGTSSTVTKTVNVIGVNDAPLVGSRRVLYDGTSVPSTQGWLAVTPGAVETTAGGVTTLDTRAAAVIQAGYSRTDISLDATDGLLLSFRANVLSETLEAAADKDNDGKTDRAAFSLTLITSEAEKAIELGFTKAGGGNLRIFAQEDGTQQVNPGLEPDSAPADNTRQFFTQAEGVTIADPGLGNYDLYVKGDTYTLLLGGSTILSGKLRNYTAFTGAPDPYETPNLIAFSDNTPSASGSFSLGTVSLISGGISDQTIGLFDVDGGVVSDFDGDRTSDILWRNQINGSILIWKMQNNGFADSSGFAATIPDAPWTMAGTADFDHDGNLDLIGRNRETSATQIWLLDNNQQLKGEVEVAPNNRPGQEWQIAGIDDFNGDDQADILWRHQTSGQLVQWYLGGAQGGEFIGGAIVNNLVDIGTNGVYPDLGWQIEATGDFNDDGAADIVWRHQQSGQISIWQMNERAAVMGGYVLDGSSDPNWGILGSGDYDGNGKSDLLWQHKTAGTVVIWSLDQGQIIGGNVLGNVDPTTWRSFV
ncbi:MAG: hypothetical protein HC824_10580 [Synechococcales cyanobacterium RM1_1_8]|nr:hypothetical protein [Synechococcales cyanobacterium RM1_1_8]